MTPIVIFDPLTNQPYSTTDPVPVASGTTPPASTAYTATDKSGTVTAGGTAQNAIAANTSRKDWRLSNLSNDILYVTDTGTAATASNGVPVYPGQTITADARGTSQSAISVLGATTGDGWSAVEYT